MYMATLFSVGCSHRVTALAVILGVASVVPSSAGADVLAAWDFSTLVSPLVGANNWGPSPLAASTTASNLSVVGLTRGPAVSAYTTGTYTAASRAWGGNNWWNSGTAADSLQSAIDRGAYITFGLTASGGYSLSVSDVAAFNVRGSSSGPKNGQWQYQIGSGSFTNIGTSFNWGSVTTSAGNPQSPMSLSSISDLQNIPAGTHVTFRIVNFYTGTAGAVTGTWYLNDPTGASTDDFIINGSVAVPERVFIDVPSGVQVQDSPLSGLIPVVKTGAGTLVLNRLNTITGSTTVQGGRLRLAHANALPSSQVVPLVGGTLTLLGSLITTVGGLSPNAGGLTDVGNGSITVVASLSAADTVRAINKGRSTGSWFGTSGITSTQAAADNASGFSRAVGWVENSDQSITVAYSAPGDTNLDWIVDVLDISKFVSEGKYGTGQPAVWAQGDFNYDGLVDIQDVAEFTTTGLYGLGVYNDASGPVSAVPEPSRCAMALAGIACGGYSMWRRRKRA